MSKTFLAPDAGRIEIREVRFRVVVSRHLVSLAALFVQAYPPALAVLLIIVDAHVDHGRHVREGVAHEPDDRAIAEACDGIRLD